MIEKMKFISLTGQKPDIDRVVNTYLSKYDIHLENALEELQDVENIRPYIQVNPYKEILDKAKKYVELLKKSSTQPMELYESMELIKLLEPEISGYDQQLKTFQEELHGYQEDEKKIEKYQDLDFEVQDILKFTFIKYRFGRIPIENYDHFIHYVYDNSNTMFVKCGEDKEYVYGVYFAPRGEAKQVDAIYMSMHFERFYITDQYIGTPQEMYSTIRQKIQEIEEQILKVQQKKDSLLEHNAPRLRGALKRLELLHQNFDVRKLAACVNSSVDTFYILCGWLAEKEEKLLKKELQQDDLVYYMEEEQAEHEECIPPTRLKNPRFIRPFESIVKMYGLPNYNEMDPTLFVAITYTIIFGAMFGDFGQGLCLLLGGLWFYKKKVDLGAVMAFAGVSASVFGILYGSFFGFEDVIKPLWLRPMTAMMDVPFIGLLNTVFVIAIGFGIFLMLISMIFHIINGIKAKDIKNVWFDQNALSGLVFYSAALIVILLLMTGHTLPGTIVLVIMFGLPLVLILFKEPLTSIITKKKGKLIEESIEMFFLQGLFELFEVLLSYFSNTLSFIRIGAFAVSHAAMMEVVLMLANAESGSPNWVVIIIGNLFVMGLEGLIVFIQVLRLEFYEMFSRFYKGSGKEFKLIIKRMKDM